MTHPINPTDKQSKDLVTIIGGQPVTTTLVIAKGVGRPHHGIIQLVRQHRRDFEEFGPLAFEMRRGEPLPQGGFGKATEYAILNEHQGMLAMTYMRNTDVVRKFKKALIRAFFALAEELQQRRSEPKPLPPMAIAIGDFDEPDRPVVVSTRFGNAYYNFATYQLFLNSRYNPQGEGQRMLVSAMMASNEFARSLPQPFRTAHKLRMAVLKANPLWSDILHCQRMGLTKATVARICGCHPSTIKRHLKKMEEAGIFDDPLAGIDLEQLEIFPAGSLER